MTDESKGFSFDPEEAEATVFQDPVAAAQQGTQAVVTAVNKDRRAAVEALEEKIQKLEERKVGEIDENTIRTITRALENVHVALSALNGYLDMMAHDLIATMENMDASAVNTVSTALHTQCMLDLLKEKGLITDAEMEEQWKVTAPEYMKKMKEAGMQRAIPEEQT
jgi:glutamine synthetase type III